MIRQSQSDAPADGLRRGFWVALRSRRPWHGLRFRLVAWYSFLAGLSLLASESLLYLELRSTLFEQVDRSLEVSAIQALKTLDDEVDRLEFDPRRDAPALASLLNDAGLEIYLLGQDGAVMESFGRSLPPAERGQLRPGFATVETADGRWRTYLTDVRSQNGRQSGWLKVARSLRPVDGTLADLLRRHLAAIPLLLGMVGCGGVFLASRALRPISRITAMASQIRRSGDLTKRIRYEPAIDDELVLLARQFDEMLDALQRMFEQQQRFMADASHELRTPLTTLRGLVQVTLRQPRERSGYVKTLQTIEQEVDRLNRLSSDLLLLSRLEQHHQELSLEPVDLSELLEAIAVQVRPLADLRQLSLTVQIAAGLWMAGSPDHLIRLFLNLLDNAVKHTPGGGVIALVARVQSSRIAVMVSDTGSGIPAQHLPHLFERFYRVEKSRSRAMGGAGLGLAIAQEIVHCHHGLIAVDSVLGRGTTFSITFPQQADAVTAQPAPAA